MLSAERAATTTRKTIHLRPRRTTPLPSGNLTIRLSLVFVIEIARDFNVSPR